MRMMKMTMTMSMSMVIVRFVVMVTKMMVALMMLKITKKH